MGVLKKNPLLSLNNSQKFSFTLRADQFGGKFGKFLILMGYLVLDFFFVLQLLPSAKYDFCVLSSPPRIKSDLPQFISCIFF